METVNVVATASISGPSFVTPGIGEAYLRKIHAVSPRVKAVDASLLLAEEQRGDLSHQADFDKLLGNAEVLFGFRLPRDVLKRAPHLKWAQMMSAGVERFLDADMVKSPVVITNASGLAAVPISEWVVCVMLMFAKQFPRYSELKMEKRWERFSSAVLSGKTLGLVGVGQIGSEVARLAKALRMNVIATRRTIRPGVGARYVDRLLPRSQLPTLLRESDFVVIAVPFTSETQHMIGEKELKAMKKTAYILNIGRGDIINEPVLIKALEEKWIAGAGLDVFTTEPLPVLSRLWELPNVIQTPHVSGSVEDYVGKACDIFARNLERYVAGRRLFNVVDKKRGY